MDNYIITLNGINEALKADYEVFIETNGSLYEIDKNDLKKAVEGSKNV